MYEVLIVSSAQLVALMAFCNRQTSRDAKDIDTERILRYKTTAQKKTVTTEHLDVY